MNEQEKLAVSRDNSGLLRDEEKMRVKRVAYNTPLPTVGIILLIMLLIPVPSFSYEKNVDRMWQQTKPITGGGCKNFIVKAGPPKIVRGRVSGRQCLTKAIQSYRQGDHEKAFGWVLASHCQDRAARELLVQNAHKALQYLLLHYGPQVAD